MYSTWIYFAGNIFHTIKSSGKFTNDNTWIEISSLHHVLEYSYRKKKHFSNAFYSEVNLLYLVIPKIIFKCISVANVVVQYTSIIKQIFTEL